MTQDKPDPYDEFSQRLPVSRGGAPAQQAAPAPANDPYADISAPAPQAENVDRSTQIMAENGGPGATQISTSSKTVTDPWMEENGALLGHLVADGASEDQLRTFIRQTGGKVENYDLSRALAERETPNFQEWRRRFPNAGYPVSALQEVKLNRSEQIAAEDSASPAGAFTAAAANAATMGGLGAVTGDEGAKKIDMMSAAHPIATIAGGAAGSALPAAAFEIGAAKLGSMVPGVAGRIIASPVTAGAAYGGTSAYLQTQDPLSALVGAAGGAIGSAVGHAVGTPSAGQSPELDRLGTLTTVGQKLGGPADTIERAWEKLPISGAFVRGARERSRTQFQRGVINDALSEIDGIGGAQGSLPKDMHLGTQPHVFVKEQFNKAYDEARAGMRLASDPEFTAGTAKLETDLQEGGLDAQALTRFNTLVRNKAMRRFDANGNMTGDDYKSAVSDLRKASAAIRKSPRGDGELADALDEYTSLLDQAARRASPPEAVAKLDAADRGYSKLVRIRMAANAQGSGGKFSPDDYANAVQNLASGQKTKSNAYLEGNALGQANADAGVTLGKKPTLRSPLEELAAFGGAGYLSHMPALGAGPALASVPYLFAARSNPLLQAGGRGVAALGAPVGATVARETMKNRKGSGK